jgi:uncharacterized membrane protein YtjA (UPF0391 family)
MQYQFSTYPTVYRKNLGIAPLGPEFANSSNYMEVTMFRATFVFLIVGLLALLLGNGNVFGLSLEMGQNLLGIFLILASISLLSGLVPEPTQGYR